MGHAATVPFFRHRPTRPGGIAMIQTLVLSSLLLALPAQAGGRGSSMLGGKAAAKVEAAEGSAEALARYNELKAKDAQDGRRPLEAGGLVRGARAEG